MLLISLFSLVAFAKATGQLEAYDEQLYSLINEPWFPSEETILSVNLTNVSPQCRNDTHRWMDSLLLLVKEITLCASKSDRCDKEMRKDIMENLNALKQLDAFGKLPPGLLEVKTMSYGSPEECKQVSNNFIYKTHYCFVKSNIGQKCSAPSNHSLYWTTAVCMPASCSDEDIVNILTDLNILNYGGLLDHCSAYCVKDEPETDAFTWVFTAVMGVIISLGLFGSALDYILENVYGSPKQIVGHTGVKALLAFSIFTNGSQILDFRPPREGHIRSLDCIRFFSMLWVVTGHIASFTGLATDEYVPLLKFPKPILMDTIMSGFFSVDSFFVLSGLLVSYMFFKMAQKNPRMVKSPFTWILFYLHRYLRLTPPYMLFICFYMVMIPLFTGVLATMLNYQQTVDDCHKYWWQNLLYINNFNTYHMCYGITWYLACDTQMYIAAPILLVAFYFSYKIGLLTAFLAVAASTTACIIVMVQHNLVATPIRDIHMEMEKYVYNVPWMRCPPYILGMVTGYFLAKYGNRRLRLHKIFILVGWAFAIAIALACIYGPHKYLDYEVNWSKGVSAIYNSLSRIGWGLFICWVVVANHYGWAGPISSFMCHPLWQPLGRLSYTAYLVHWFIIYYFLNLRDRPLHWTSPGAQFLEYTIPVTVMAYVFAFFWSCLCELPFLKLEKLLVDGLMSRKRLAPAPEDSKEKRKIQENWEDEAPELRNNDLRL